MKTAELKSSLLMRKGTAAPVSVPMLQGGHPSDSAGASPAAAPVQRPGVLRRDRLGRVRHSLRLDAQRHLRLKLLAAHTQQSLQDVFLAALDAHLDRHGEGILDGHCACLKKGELSDECSEPCTTKAKRSDGRRGSFG